MSPAGVQSYLADVSAGDAYVASCHAVMEPQDTGGGSGGSVGGGSRDVFAGSSQATCPLLCRLRLAGPRVNAP